MSIVCARHCVKCLGYRERAGSLVEAGHKLEGSLRKVACVRRTVRLRRSSWFCPECLRLYCGLGAVYIKM